jgi:DNA-binding response OmpR family regulator
MPPPTYQQVNVILAEPEAEMTAPLRTAMAQRGLRHVSICRDAAHLDNALNHRSVDVLLCDIDLAGLKFREAMQRIRRNEVGRNPFVQIIAMMGHGGRDHVQHLIGAGVDDLIRKPMTPARLASRFEALTRPRKPFVIAESYIGPNRRKGPRVTEGYSMVPVPNSLRSKVVDGLHPTQVQEALDHGWKLVIEAQSRSRRNAITVLTRRILNFYDGKGSPEELRRDLGYLVSKAEELIVRHRRTDSQHVAEIAACMGAVALRMIESPMAPQPKDVKLIPHLSIATRMSSQSPKESIATVREIVELIREYLK